MTMESTIQNIGSGVTVLATDAQIAAPIVSIFHPGAGAAMAILAPMAASFIVKSGQMIIDWRKDMTPEEMVAALNASKSANWPAPPPIAAE